MPVKIDCPDTRARRSSVVLRSIAVFEAGKGLLALVFACGMLSLRNIDLADWTVTFLRQHGIDPQQHYPRLLVELTTRAGEFGVVNIVGLALAYALLRLTVGYGLWRHRHWAEWVAVFSAGLFLPWELYHFIRHGTLLGVSVIFTNILIIIYLANHLRNQRQDARFKAMEESVPPAT